MLTFPFYRSTLLLVAVFFAAATATAAIPTFEELEDSGAIIGKILFETKDVFDTTQEEEDKALYRFANRLHVETRRSTIKSQLLFRVGETLDINKIRESERLLRRNEFLFEASIHVSRYENGMVDLTITTRDNWTLFPEISFTRSGGENESIFGIEDTNVFGTGSRISITREDDVDRSSTVFEFSDRNVGRSWVGVDLTWSDADDGHSRSLSVRRPFYSLDARWSAGLTLLSDDRVDTLYSNGDEAARYRHDQRFTAASFGWSAGLVDGWVRRWTVGAVLDDNDFSPRTPALPTAAPNGRDLVYPYVALQVLQDRFATTTNFKQIAQTEDLFLGTSYGVRIGWAGLDAGSDRDALVFGASHSRSAGSPESDLWLIHASTEGRLESGDLENAMLKATARYYSRKSDRRTFYAMLDLTAGHDLDLDNPVYLGGESGLRGYPYRYRNGESSALLRLEQRYFTDYYPWRLFRVGGALFFDAGRIFGKDVTGREDDDILTDVGLGLRLGNTRIGSNKIIHIDVAFPLNGESSIDSVQLSIDGRQGF